jgi:hypothetical protein
LPKIERGYLLSFREVNHGPTEDTIHWDSLTAPGQGAIPFWFEGAAGVWMNDVGVTADGEFLVAGVVRHARQSPVNNFLAWVDPTGAVLKVMDLGSYEAERVCGTSDGNVWTLGQDWGAQSTYDMLRKYSSAGDLQASYLGRTSLSVVAFDLSVYMHSQGETYPHGLPPGMVYLRCGEESVGAYIGPAATWFQVQLADGSTQRWVVKRPMAPTGMTGMALTAANEVYASFKGKITGGNSANPPAYQYGLYVLDLHGPTPVWDAVPGSVGSSGQPFGKLVGGDGQSLVYTGIGDIAPDGTVALSWTAR